MKERRFVDISNLGFRKMDSDGNIDLRFWHNKTIAQRIEGAITMIKVAFQEPDFVHQKVDRSIISIRKRV
jgi:hypothetical protein